MLDHLPTLHVKPHTITLSGNSLGATFAHDLSIIYSSEFVGVGLVNGGSYYNEKNHKDKYITGKTSFEMA